MNGLELNQLINRIDKSNQISFDEGFKIAKICSELLAQGNTDQLAQARRIAIHVLDKKEKMPPTLYPIWNEIIESLGFYPYIQKERFNSLSDDIRKAYYRSEYLPGIYLHQNQKEISELIFSGQNIVLSAPTSYGKSLLIEEVVASNKYRNIVIIQPTLALLDETRIKLLKYADSYKLIVRTTQDYNELGSNIFLLTAERVLEYEKFPHIKLLIIDEFYKISYAREDERVDILNNAFMRIYYEFHPQFYFLGPNVMSISPSFEREFDAKFVHTNYSMVDSIEINENVHSNKRTQKKQTLFNLLMSFKREEQSLVYCSSPDKARELAFDYYMHLCNHNLNARCTDLPLIEWIRKEIGYQWSVVKELEYGIAIHDGSMPKHLGASIIRYFNTHKIDVIFCTPTIIEGVNTSAKNVIVYSEKKGPKKLDYFDYSNIKGRAGRLMEHFVGRVYNFIDEPEQKALSIDMPFSDQEGLTEEVIINIPPDKVKPQIKEKYDELQKIPLELKVIIKRNGVKIKSQQKLAQMVEEKIKRGDRSFIWSRIPKWDELISTLYLLDECQLIKFDGRVKTVSQLCFFLTRYYEKKTIINYFKSFPDINEENYDKKLEDAFYIQRQWFQFTVPKLLRVCESIVNYVCSKYNDKGCSYSYYAQQLETSFLPDKVSILLEYGIPAITIRKIERFVPNNISDDDLITYLKQQKSMRNSLLSYEIDLIDNNL